jgi:hypothetical protein
MTTQNSTQINRKRVKRESQRLRTKERREKRLALDSHHNRTTLEHIVEKVEPKRTVDDVDDYDDSYNDIFVRVLSLTGPSLPMVVNDDDDDVDGNDDDVDGNEILTKGVSNSYCVIS